MSGSRPLSRLAAALSWRFLDLVVASWWQLRAAVWRVRPEKFLAGDLAKPLIVLLPGVYEPWRFMLPAARGLHSQGYRLSPVPGLGRNLKSVAEGARLVQESLAELAEKAVTAGRRERVVLLAHSKGGLVGKQVLIDYDATAPANRTYELHGMVAVATPFAGSRYASRYSGRTLSELNPAHQTIRRLQAALAVNARIVSLFPQVDPLIPGERGLEGSRQGRLNGSGHFRTLAAEETAIAITSAVAWLEQPQREASAEPAETESS
ncbi:alpha-beta hydrolase superfamily lysophospholipase [Psychromicrobium silvestre]|uniref:Alpha-beta hydrolase superfamily lysophospholipase n=1 Tax=Psychromicrobium silvestre TaxID=1645614 RepID=A0A7Y9S881_9MICC|nr:alpha/beta hydrolase [Psychromicrobium silvestre]NYE95706.1 alpha-beta hydrolase superfamily lysophospholipase [Psychromicrobium silvestre]